MSVCPLSAMTASLPAPPRATSAVRSRMLTWSSPSSPETMSRPPPGLMVSLPDPPTNSSDEPPPVSVSLPAPPAPVTSKGPTSPTVSASSPPSPLACMVSLEPTSIVNGTRLVRSNLILAPFGWTVKMSPAAGAPLTSTSSRPASPFATSVPSPLFHTSVSSPAPPFIVSVPRSPTMRSSPPPPLRTSSPSPPTIRSGPSEPLIVSAPAPPSTDSSVNAPTPSFRGDRIVATEAVDLEALGRGVERELTQVRPPQPDGSADGIEREHVAERRRAVDLRDVVAGVADRRVGSVALVPHQRVVARPAVHDVVALAGDQAVVAIAAGERVVAVGARHHVVAAISVEPGTGELGGLREHRDRVVALAAVHDHRARAVGRHGLIAILGAVPVRTAGEPAGRLAMHQHTAGHRHRHVVISAVEIERRGQIIDRRRADRGLRRDRGCGQACGQRCG